MQLGMIGLGRMGANLVRRLQRAGHTCVVHDVNPLAVAELAADGATPAHSLATLAGALAAPRVVWIMVPAAHVGATIERIAEHLEPGDIVIDGGNSFFGDDLERAATLAAQGVHFVDVGTSGGVFGLERGYCLMIGGEEEPVAHLDPIFRALAPGVEAAERTPSRAHGPTNTAEAGYLHCGPPGAGHFVKMVHNGIEYGLMAAFAEGFNLLRHAGDGIDGRRPDAETAPLRHPERFRYDFDVAGIAEVWRRGSVVTSWLLDLTAEALAADPGLEGFAGRVSDSGEGRWTVEAAVETATPVHVLAAALFSRFSSRGEADYGDRLLSAMRKQFGGHQEPPVKELP